MKLIQQTTLVFGAASKQKVFEIDLCEVSPNWYVVNFRYGRRGGRLKDGTKTPAAVPERQAREVFDKLVESKVNAGYAVSDDFTGSVGAASAPPSEPPPATASRPTAGPDTSRAAGASSDTRADSGAGQRTRDEVILARLRHGDSRVQPLHRRVLRGRGREAEHWPLDRVIWRAGELGLEAAVPHLIDLLATASTPLRQYNCAWSLSRCARRGDQGVIAELRRLHGDTVRTADMVRRVAAEGILALSDEAGRAAFREQLVAGLPGQLRRALDGASAESFTNALTVYMDEDDPNRIEDVHTLYLIDSPVVRRGLLHWLRTAPLAPNRFKAVRQVFKAAEQRLDGEVWGIIAHRFETTRAFFSSARYGTAWRRAPDGRYIKVDASELGRPNARFCYSTKTRNYLRRRVWRRLRRLGQQGDARSYVKMAVGLLLPFSDGGANLGTINESQWSSYWAVNHVLYGNGQRGVARDDRLGWRWLSRASASGREESFPRLWDEVPQGLLHLLDESEHALVHEFAVRALRDNPQFTRQLGIDALVMLLEARYPWTARLGFDLVFDRLDLSSPDPRLVLAVANSSYKPGREQSFRWIEQARTELLASVPFVCGLVASPQRDTREFARRWLRSSVIGQQTARAIVGRLVAMLMAATDAEDERQVSDVAETMRLAFARELGDLGEAVLADLIGHPIEAVQVLGGDVLASHPVLSRRPPEGLLVLLLDSEHEAVRATGVRLLQAMDDDALTQRPQLLVAMALSSHEPLRSSALALTRRLASNASAFGRAVGHGVLEALGRRKAIARGVGPDLLTLMAALLEHGLDDVEADTVKALLIKGPTAVAKEVGGLLLSRFVDIDALSVGEIARLGAHEIRTVREGGWALYRGNVERIRDDMVAAVRIFDTKWDDTLEFAFEFFGDGQRFGAEDFSPVVLIGIVDNPNAAVQQFGRSLLTRYFPEAEGQDVMLKLSEHPSSDVQLLVSNYLERFAAGRPEVLAQLEPYFRMALGRVNKGGVTKARLHAFLEAQARESEAAAEVVAGLMARQSATMAIEDRARAIATMVVIGQCWPQIELPIQVTEPEVRGGVHL